GGRGAPTFESLSRVHGTPRAATRESAASESAAAGLGKLADDEVVGVLDHVLDHLLGERAVEDHGIPVPLVQVIAGEHRRVCLAELLRELRFALEADPQRAPAKLGQGEHLASDLEHRCLRAKGKGLLRSRKREAVLKEDIRAHLRDDDRSPTITSRLASTRGPARPWGRATENAGGRHSASAQVALDWQASPSPRASPEARFSAARAFTPEGAS